MKKEGSCCDNSFGIASVVLGVVGAVLGVLVVPIIFSVLGLIFGVVQYRREKNAWAIWGVIVSILGIIISVYIIWQLATALSQFQATIATCQANPAAQGCADLLKLTGGMPLG